MEILIYIAFGIVSFLIGLYAAISLTHDTFVNTGSAWQSHCKKSVLDGEFKDISIRLNKRSKPQVQISIIKSIVFLLVNCMMAVLYGGILILLLSALLLLISDGVTNDATYLQAFVMGIIGLVGYLYGRGQVLSALLQSTHTEIAKAYQIEVSTQQILETRLKRVG